MSSELPVRYAHGMDVVVVFRAQRPAFKCEDEEASVHLCRRLLKFMLTPSSSTRTATKWPCVPTMYRPWSKRFDGTGAMHFLNFPNQDCLISIVL